MDHTKSCWCPGGSTAGEKHRLASSGCPRTTPDDYVGLMIRCHIGGNLHHLYRVVGTKQIPAGFQRDGKDVIYTMLRMVPLAGVDLVEGEETCGNPGAAVTLDDLRENFRPLASRQLNYDSAMWPNPGIGHSPHCWEYIYRRVDGTEITYEWPDTDGAGMIR